MDKNTVVCVGIVCLAGIGATALLNGIDGTILTAISGTIGTIIGYMFGKSQNESVQ